LRHREQKDEAEDGYADGNGGNRQQYLRRCFPAADPAGPGRESVRSPARAFHIRLSPRKRD